MYSYGREGRARSRPAAERRLMNSRSRKDARNAGDPVKKRRNRRPSLSAAGSKKEPSRTLILFQGVPTAQSNRRRENDRAERRSNSIHSTFLSYPINIATPVFLRNASCRSELDLIVAQDPKCTTESLNPRIINSARRSRFTSPPGSSIRPGEPWNARYSTRNRGGLGKD